MAAAKSDMTWADYLAVAVAPVLIMALVGSLVFFLLDIGYAGEFSGRLRWILFCFVFGSVMLARVSITQGVAHAGILGFCLGAATALAMITFVDNALVACLLIGVIWWCAHKLTWNCTFIDETIDPSAAGLLETAGKDDRWADNRIGTRSKAETVFNPLAEDTFRAADAVALQRASWWKRTWHAITDLEPRAHAPGLSVLYFSLAALPLFGLGQWLIPATADGRQAAAFGWLTIYLASGLALLSVTSFLGLRRYLRRRGLDMPAAMTSSWIGVGGLLIVALLVLGMLLPLPSARNDLSVAFRDRMLGSPEREASQVAPLKTDGTRSDDPDASRTSDETPEGEQESSTSAPNEPGGAPGEKGSTSSEDSKVGEASENGDKSNSQQPNNPGEQSGESDGETGEQSSDDNSSQDGKSPSQPGQRPNDPDDSKKPGGGNSPQGKSQSGPPSQSSPAKSGSQGTPPSAPPAHSPPASPPNPLQNIASWLKPVLWIAAIVLVVVLAIVFRRQILAFLREIVDIWRGLWGIVFPRKARAEKAAAPPKSVLHPFASFSNPFADGRAQRASADELVKYTFAALEAWCHEHGAAHRQEETPLEFAARATAQFSELGTDATRVAGWLARSLYARQAPPKECLTALRSLWVTLQRSPAPTLVATGH